MREPTREQVERVVDAIEAAYALNEISVRVFDAAALLRALLDRAETAERDRDEARQCAEAWRATSGEHPYSRPDLDSPFPWEAP